VQFYRLIKALDLPVRERNNKVHPFQTPHLNEVKVVEKTAIWQWFFKNYNLVSFLGPFWFLSTIGRGRRTGS
jgi:hypothetical protein